MCLGCYVFTTVLQGSSNELPFCLQIFANMADDSRREKRCHPLQPESLAALCKMSRKHNRFKVQYRFMENTNHNMSN